MRTAYASFLAPLDATPEQIAIAEANTVTKLRQLGAYGEVYREGIEETPWGLRFTYTAKEY